MTVKNLLFKNSRSLKYFIFSLTCVVFAVMLTSCEQNPTAPNEPPKPPGYQEDIYWPSLADSPWPMNHHDPQNTGRGTCIGPQEGIINWKFNGLYIEAAPVMANDSILYFTETGAIHSLNINSKLNWTYNTNSQ